MKKPRVALAHDYLNQYGGAERVLEALHALYPEAPVYTSMYWPEKMSPTIRGMDVRTSFMQSLPFVKQKHQPFLPLYPLAFESFDLSGYDLVISNSSAFCKGVITQPHTLHVCYCLTPMRWVWSYRAYVERERLSRAVRTVLPAAISQLRAWDVASAQNVDRFIGISRAVAARINKYYRRDAAVIYPPVSCSAFAPQPGREEDYYLVVSRLIPYKRIDLAIDACTRLGVKLKVVGGGRDEADLRARAGPTVQFLGRVSDAELKDLLARCRAFIFPGEEDFGITPLEASASGRPVVAFAAGGALDTIAEGQTGVFFREQRVEAVMEAIQTVELHAWDPHQIRAHAERFDTSVFHREMGAFVEQSMEAFFARGERFG